MDDCVKKYMSWIITIGILCFLVFQNVLPDASIWDNIGYSISVTSLLSVAYCNWLWRWNPIESTPKLYKKYKGTIISDFDNIEREAEIEIKQTLLKVQVFLVTKESRSKAVTSRIYENSGEKLLTYGYLNTPNAVVRNRSEIHCGMCTLNVDNPKELIGQYFTDRKTRGDMHFHAVEKGGVERAN